METYGRPSRNSGCRRGQLGSESRWGRPVRGGPLLMNPLAWLTNREEVLTREHFPGLAPYIRRLRTPLGPRPGGRRGGALRDVPAPARVRGLLRCPGGDDRGPGLALAGRLRAGGLAGGRSPPLPRRGNGEARLTLRNRMFWSTCGVAIKGGFHAPSGERGDETALVGLASVPPRPMIVETIEFVLEFAASIPCAGLGCSAGSHSACGRRRGR